MTDISMDLHELFRNVVKLLSKPVFKSCFEHFAFNIEKKKLM